MIIKPLLIGSIDTQLLIASLLLLIAVAWALLESRDVPVTQHLKRFSSRTWGVFAGVLSIVLAVLFDLLPLLIEMPGVAAAGVLGLLGSFTEFGLLELSGGVLMILTLALTIIAIAVNEANTDTE